MAEMIRVVLIGEDNQTQHAQGYMSPDKLPSLLERNKRVYHYDRYVSGYARYVECGPPVIITEF